MKDPFISIVKKIEVYYLLTSTDTIAVVRTDYDVFSQEAGLLGSEVKILGH